MSVQTPNESLKVPVSSSFISQAGRILILVLTIMMRQTQPSDAGLTGWAGVEDHLMKNDTGMMKDYSDDIDTLLVFVSSIAPVLFFQPHNDYDRRLCFRPYSRPLWFKHTNYYRLTIPIQPTDS